MPADEERHGVALTNLDKPLFDGAGATKRDLVDYLEAMADRLLPVLAGRPLSVVRVRPGAAPFMQKNVPASAPAFVKTVTVWAESSKREVRYAICDDVRTLLWFGNQRAVELHPALVRGGRLTHLVLDLDPPEGAPFAAAVAATRLVGAALDQVGLRGAVKTSGAKGMHVFVPIAEEVGFEAAAAATRAIAARAAALDPAVATTAFVKDEREGKVFVDPTRTGGATVVAAYSPRIRPGVPVSFPVAWSDLDAVDPRDFTIATAPGLLAGADPWTSALPSPQRLPDDLVAEGHSIPIPRVRAMHEGKRRKRARDGSD